MNNNEATRTAFEKAQEALRNAPKRVLNPKTGRMVTVKAPKVTKACEKCGSTKARRWVLEGQTVCMQVTQCALRAANR